MADTLGAKASGAAYERLRDSLALIESSGNPSVEQRVTFAKGFYQFVPSQWGDWIQTNTGRSLGSFLPRNDSPAEMARSAKEQREILFPTYYEKEIAPFIAKTRKDGLGKGRTDTELATIFHKLGSGHARDYLKTGYDFSAGTADNEAIEAYVSKVSRTAAGAPSQLLVSALSSAEFRDNRIEHRADEDDTRYFEQLTPAEQHTRRVANKAKAAGKGHTPLVAGRKDDLRGPPRIAMAASRQTPPVSFLPEAAMSENGRVLAELNILRQRLGQSLNEDAALDRIRAEGRGY